MSSIRCGFCHSAVTVVHKTYHSTHSYWNDLLELLSIHYSCICYKGTLVRCVICKSDIASGIVTIHLIKCLHKCETMGSTIKIGKGYGGNGNNENIYEMCFDFVRMYPQLLVVNGFGIDWIAPDEYYDRNQLREIITKKLETMDFHCMICGCNYETFPTGEILLTHLTGCVKSREN